MTPQQPRYWCSKSFCVAHRARRMYSVALFLLICAVLSGCRNKVALPNGYYLKDLGNQKIKLYNRDAKLLNESNITDVMIEGECVYGWIDVVPYQFFFIDTANGKFLIFNTWKKLDQYTDKLSLPRLAMRRSKTFWDLKNAGKGLIGR